MATDTKPDYSNGEQEPLVPQSKLDAAEAIIARLEAERDNLQDVAEAHLNTLKEVEAERDSLREAATEMEDAHRYGDPHMIAAAVDKLVALAEGGDD